MLRRPRGGRLIAARCSSGWGGALTFTLADGAVEAREKRRRTRVFRLQQDFLRDALLDHLAGIQADHPSGTVAAETHLVGAQVQRPTPPPPPLPTLPHL